MSKQNYNARTWGFRFSFTDAIVIGVVGSAAVVSKRLDSPLWWMLVVVVGHFFLFCNVFRIVRRRELIWSGVFLFNICLWIGFDDLTWLRVLMCQLPVTFGLVVANMRAPGYHGICAKRLNPRLDDYLAGRIP